MCRSQNPPNFSEKKNSKDQNSVFCTKNNILFLVSTRNDNISRGCATKTEFPEGRGVRFESQFLENPEGRGGHRKNPFRGGGMDIFWNYTIDFFTFKQNSLFCLLARLAF